MPTFADKKILSQNLEISGKDLFPVSNSSRGKTGSRIEQVPAAIVSNYTHAYLINFDSASFNVASGGSTPVSIPLKTFSTPVIIRDAAIIVTKTFTGLGGSADASFTDSSGDPIHFVRAVPITSAVGAEIMNSNPSDTSTVEPAETLLIPADGSIKAKFSGEGTNLDQATAGQVIFLANIIDVNEYINIIPPFD